MLAAQRESLPELSESWAFVFLGVGVSQGYPGCLPVWPVSHAAWREGGVPRPSILSLGLGCFSSWGLRLEIKTGRGAELRDKRKISELQGEY